MSKSFTKKLLTWNETNDRPMLWKGEKNPYFIWLSEVILQQTRVEQGSKYYHKFISNYPRVEDLANAEENDVLKDWEGLGYYSRARNLHYTAKKISSEFGGKFPSNYKDLLQLKGVGTYTASAIASFAFNLPHAVVDGNVIRVLSRFFGIDHPFDTSEGKKIFEQKAQELLDIKDPATYNQAIMDFGATVCKPLSPCCEECPLNRQCFAYQHDLTNVLPVKSKKIDVKKRFFNYLVIMNKDHVLIRKRHKSDIWKGLHDFPLIEDKKLLNLNELKKQGIITSSFQSENLDINPIFFDYQQLLTHQKISARFFILNCEKLPIIEDYFPVKHKKIGIFAFPKLINFFLDEDFVSFI